MKVDDGVITFHILIHGKEDVTEEEAGGIGRTLATDRNTSIHTAGAPLPVVLT